jgi:hypothetical protein
VRLALSPTKPKERHRSIEGLAVSDVAKLFEDREKPGQWHVERIGDYGLSETKMFSGPDALRRALRYANAEVSTR